jgi:small subunit ribosomal protein S3
MARRETQKQGSIPLQTLQANVAYGFSAARTKTGAIGVKVWIYLGEFGDEITPIDTGDSGRGRRRGRR